MKKFKSKKRRKKKILFYLLIIIIAYLFTTKFLMKIELQSSNEEFIKNMLNDSSHYKKYEKKNYFNFFSKYILNLDLKNPKNILQSVFNYKTESNKKELLESKYIINNKEPSIYIYNTHESEGYMDNNLKDYNINPNVKMASYLLQGLLEKENINSIVEEGSMSKYLSDNNIPYSESYEASRYYINNILNAYPNLKLMIDLHRDAVTKDRSTVEINGKKFAKVLFVIGTNNPHYEENLSLANHLNDLIKDKYPTLTRGVLTKDGTGKRCRFNQDLNNKIILIEVGGNENTIDEVMNTIVVLEDVIKEYLGE